MKILIIALLLFPLAVFSQGLAVSSDSSNVQFPNQVIISINKIKLNGRTYFQLERKSFKALVLTTNQYLKQNSISEVNVKLLQKNQSLLDSSFQLLEKKLVLEKDRTILYQQANEDLKKISSTYNDQLMKCTSNLSELKKKKNRSSFIKGFLWGTALVGGVFALASVSN